MDTAFAYFVVFALFCAICVAFECYVHFLHNFSRLFACRLQYICTCVCHLRNQETFRLFPPLAVATRLAPQHTCERPVLSPHLGPLCLGLFNLSLQRHQLSLKPALRSGGEVRRLEGRVGAGREEVKSPLFLGETELTLVTEFPELYLECPLGVLWW